MSQEQKQLENSLAITSDNFQMVFEDLVKLYAVQDPIRCEFLLVESAKHFEIPLESFRQMFKDYCLQQEEKQALGSWWKAPLYRFEKSVEKFSQFLDEMDLFRVIGKLTSLSIILGVITFLAEIPQRAERQATEQKRANYEAWQIVRTNQEQTANGGRVDAIQDLNKRNVNLSGLDVEKAILIGIDLEGAELVAATFRDGVLFQANLQNANLDGVDFRNVDMRRANLRNTRLWDANFEGANLENVNFAGAELYQPPRGGPANFQGAKGLTPEQIKQARNWENAKYDPVFRNQLGLPLK